MPESKDTTSFFRKVVKFVANPATEWAEIDAPLDDGRENDYAKGELKAMIERKRRNDFVRKREFDMLRKVRREGLTGEQLAALAGSSRLDDSEPRLPDSGARQDSGVKAKIDEIEQQMVSENFAPSPVRRAPEFYNAATAPAPLDTRPGRMPVVKPVSATPSVVSGPAARTNGGDHGGGRVDPSSASPAPAPAKAASAPVQEALPRPTPGAPPAGTLDFSAVPEALTKAFGASSNAEVTHDPELDESVIAFANADFEQCEQALVELTSPTGARAQHAETWLVRFDLYRATGQQHKFESLALDYAQQFGWSAPQWFSMPRLVAEAVSDERPANVRLEGQVGWVCPEYLDADGVAQLSSLSLQMPLPWVFDWAPLKSIDAEACGRLSELFRSWIPQDLDIRWLSGECLLSTLQEAAPTGVRDADPAFWQVRLDALRMTHRPDQFDEAAIDYCVTYEVSPPSWEPARCEVRVSGSSAGTTQRLSSMVSDVMTSFVESQVVEESGTVEVGRVELSGQLVGDIGATLAKMDAELGSAEVIHVSCARLIRVDFIAAGDLLNWVLARRAERRTVSFLDAHRIVALFFGAMGINEHAAVKVRIL